MAEIWTRATRQRQPQGAVGVDWGNPLARDLTVAFLPGVGEIVSNTPDLQPVRYTQFGRVVDTSIGTTRECKVGAAYNQPFTFLTAIIAPFVSQNPFAFGMPVTGGGPGWRVDVDTSSGGFYIGATANGVANLPQFVSTSPFPNSLPYVYSFSRALAGSYVQRLTGFSDDLGSVGYNTPAVGSTLKIPGGISGGQYFIQYVFYWARVLSATELNAVSRNPWQLFAPERRVSYFSPASGIPTLSAATAVSIGSTTATPRVTVTF